MADAQGRKLVSENIGGETFSLKEFEYGTVDEAIEFLTRLKERNAGKELKLVVHQESYSDHEYWQVQEVRRETDAEMAERVATEERYANERRTRELAELDRLRKQYPEA